MDRLIKPVCLLSFLSATFFLQVADTEGRRDILGLETTPFTIPEPYRDLLADYRKSWHRLTGINPSALHWNQSIVVLINQSESVYRHNYLTYMKQLEDDFDDEDEIQFETYPTGTVLLKEHYAIQVGQPVTGLTVALMIKRQPGYAPDHGDWQYVQFSASGQLMIDGRGSDPLVWAQCASCHQNIAERDFVFHSYYARPPS